MKNNKNQQGNALFLILIAVTLFAALSYAITQTTGGGAGDTSNETNLVNSSVIMQFPPLVRTGIDRLTIGGVSISNVDFETDASACGTPANCIFHPTGGGITYQQVPPEILTGTTPVDWIFETDSNVTDLGTSGDEIIMIAPGLTQDVCNRINNRLNGADAFDVGTADLTSLSNTTLGGGAAGSNITDDEFDGVPRGCVDGAAYYYYHVISES